MAVARNCAYFFGTAPISVGLLALISPNRAANPFGALLSTPAQTDSTTYLAAKGVRDITLGICYFVFGYRSDIGALRTLMLAHVVTGAVDSILVWKNGATGKALGHGVGTLGLGFMLWARYV